MIYSYDSVYLDDAMESMGDAMDYAANYCHVEMDEFLEVFIGSGFAERFATGEPKVVAGISGAELVWNVLEDSGMKMDFPPIQIDYERSPQYWSGWILAYYQWFTGQSFEEIRNIITMRDIEKLYPTLHEASEQKFVDVVNKRTQSANLPTRLQRQRKISGYSQRILAEKAGVNLRTLQQYELRAKDINRAAGSTLLSLARVLGCKVEDLLEYDIEKDVQ